MAKKFNIHDWQAEQRLAEVNITPGTHPELFYDDDFKKMQQTYSEPGDPQYDGPGGEGKMAKGDIIELAKDASDVAEMIGPNTNLPEWVESKITKAADAINTVKDYLSNYDASREELEELNMTGTGASFSAGSGEGYMSHNAFGDDKEKKMKTYKSLGYKKV